MAPTPVHYLSPQEVGEMIGTSGDTIRRIIKSQKLKAIRMPPGNYYKIPPLEVLRYVQAYDIPLTDANQRLLEGMIAEGNGGGQ
jgi:excisionase family DNA binding protein